MINWQLRYSKILANEPKLFDPKYSVLEIGPGDNGAAKFLNRKVYGVQSSFGLKVHPFLMPQMGTAEALPYADDSVDFTICMDVLANLEPEKREKAVKEIVRVTKESAWVAFPSGGHAQLMELSLHESINKFNLKSPEWLVEHLSNALPKLEEILLMLKDENCDLEISVNEYLGDHFNALMADLFMPRYREIFNLRVSKIGKLNPFVEDKFDFPYSILLKISKNIRRNRVVTNPSIVRPKEPDRNIKIYSVSHVFSNEYGSIFPRSIIPLYVGDAAKPARRGGLESDILETEAVLDNGRWCELTGIYKIWKSAHNFSHVGFCHYRRLFNFSETFELTSGLTETAGFQRSTNIRADDLAQARHNLSPDSSLFDETETIIVPPPAILPTGIFEQYTIAHSASDYLKVLSIIYNDYPGFREVLSKTTADNHMFANNMFILSSNLFDELCTFWFGVLLKFEADNQKPNGNDKIQSRDIAYLSERVFDIWIKKKIGEGIKTKFVSIYNIRYEKLKMDEWSPTNFMVS